MFNYKDCNSLPFIINKKATALNYLTEVVLKIGCNEKLPLPRLIECCDNAELQKIKLDNLTLVNEVNVLTEKIKALQVYIKNYIFSDHFIDPNGEESMSVSRFQFM